MITINKELLKNYRFSDNAVAWILEAKGFMDAAMRLLNAPSTRQQNTKFVSTADANLCYMNQKVVAYLFAVAIELFLKGIYCAKKSPEDQEKTESFGHNVIKLTQKLVAKGIFKKNELHKETLELAYIILEWSGRYYKPLPAEVERIISSYFEEVSDQPTMVKPKFSINKDSIKSLQHVTHQLAEKSPINPASIEHLLFLPF